MKLKAILAASTIPFVLAACNQPADTEATKAKVEAPDPDAAELAADPTVVGVAGTNPVFGTFTAAVKSADLRTTLRGEGPFTVFAPTNAAFTKMDQARMAELMGPDAKADLATVLTYHVLPVRLSMEELTKRIEAANGFAKLTTVAGATLTASQEGPKTVIADDDGNKAVIANSDVAASNGVIHGVDTVLVP